MGLSHSSEQQAAEADLFQVPSPNNLTNKPYKTTASKDNIRFFYKIGKVLGHGAFGTVRIAYSREQLTRKFAIKTIHKDRMQEKPYMIRRELEIIYTLDHPNIIKFYEIFQDDLFIHFVMEFNKGIELYQYCQSHGAFSEDVGALILRQIFSGIAHMHQKNVIHRDIKPENILFFLDEKGPQIKLIDFGLSRIITTSFLKQLPSQVGTPLYVAPEIIQQKMYGKECDCWSLGVLTYWLLTGVEPFYAKNIQEVYAKIKKGVFDVENLLWTQLSREAQSLIRQLIVVNPENRLSCRNALRHPFFTKQQAFDEERRRHQLVQSNTPKLIKNLLGYVNDCRLKREAIKILIKHHLSEEEILALQSSFEVLDVEGTGDLTVENIEAAIKELHLPYTRKEVEKAFREIHAQDDDKELILSFT